MNRLLMMIAVAAVCCWTAIAEAQWVTTYYRAPTTVYYSPAPAVGTTAYYAPAPHAVYYAPAPRVVRYAPAPAPVAAVPVYTTRYRPLLGGSITRVRYRYAPVATAAPATVAYYPAW